MQYYCSVCHFTQNYMLAPSRCRRCARMDTMRAGRPPRGGFSIAGPCIFNNQTGQVRLFEPAKERDAFDTLLLKPRHRKKTKLDLLADLVLKSEASKSPSIVTDSGIENYALVHTIGGNTLKRKSGDGAYAEWLDEHFSSQESRCVGVFRLQVERVGHRREGELQDILVHNFSLQLQKILASSALKKTQTVILNWHLRFSARPNSNTGRGISQRLIDCLTLLAQKARKNLKIIYTIHEIKGIRLEHLVSPCAIITLNKTVCNAITKLASSLKVPVYCSAVPNLMSSAPTKITDIISGYIGEQLNPDFCLGADYGKAFFLSKLKSRNLNSNNSHRTIPGVLIFGSITARHGVSQTLLQNFSRYLDQNKVNNGFKIILAGATSDRSLTKKLETLSRSKSRTNYRILFHGLLNSFDDLSFCRYAISFDEDGFRTNASAMINSLRAGHLLFARNPGESDNDLALRAATEIARCEINIEYYLKYLAAQQPTFKRLERSLVGIELARIFFDTACERVSKPPSQNLNIEVARIFTAIETIKGTSKKVTNTRNQLKSVALAIVSTLIEDPTNKIVLERLQQLKSSLGISVEFSSGKRSDSSGGGFDYADFMPFPSDEKALFYRAHHGLMIKDASAHNNNCLIHSLLRLTIGMPDDEVEAAGDIIRAQLVLENRTTHLAFLYTYYHGRRILELIKQHFQPYLNIDQFTIREHWTYDGEVMLPDSIGDGTSILDIWNSGGHYQTIHRQASLTLL